MRTEYTHNLYRLHHSCTKGCTTWRRSLNEGLAVATAMRLGEIVGLQWENLDEATRTIIIRERKHPTKKATNHQKVPLPFVTCTVGSQLIDPLQIMLRQPSAWARKGRIFPHAAQSVWRAFQRATDDTGIVDLRFHDLRHDGAPRLFEAGSSIEQLALVTGHRDWNMLRRYTQLGAEDFNRRPANAEASGSDAQGLSISKSAGQEFDRRLTRGRRQLNGLLRMPGGQVYQSSG
jgi:integrase